MQQPPPGNTGDSDLELSIERVAAHPEPDGNMRVMLATTRGEIRAIIPPYATRSVEQLNKTLLLVHGKRDRILDYAASEDIFARAHEPKNLVLYEQDEHMLTHSAEQLEDLLAEWLTSILRDAPAIGRN